MFEVMQIPAFKDNFIWLLRKGASAVVVDPGDAVPVLEVLDREKLILDSILITHHHKDHQGGVAQLLEKYSAQVFGPALESITGKTQALRGGERISLLSLGVIMQVIAVPGHTLGHLAYYGHGRLFCGDTLFAGGCGRVFEGSYVQMHDSLTRLAGLPDETLVYCAHEYTEANLRFAYAVEPANSALSIRSNEVAVLRAKGLSTVPSTLAVEKATNPFLRCHVPEVRLAAQARGIPGTDEAAVFAAIREWKNDF